METLPISGMKSYKNRTIDYSRKVRVYPNRNKVGHYLSISQDSYVRGHTQTIHLINCTFMVSQAESARTKKTGKRNVHAYVEGLVCVRPDLHPSVEKRANIEVNYDPFKQSSFKTRDGDTISEAKFVYYRDGVLYASLDK